MKTCWGMACRTRRNLKDNRKKKEEDQKLDAMEEGAFNYETDFSQYHTVYDDHDWYVGEGDRMHCVDCISGIIMQVNSANVVALARVYRMGIDSRLMILAHATI